MPLTSRIRLDDLLVKQGYYPDRETAVRAIFAGEVRSECQDKLKPGSLVRADSVYRVNSASRYVSRGGDKLAAAIAAWPVVVAGATCIDIGASSGGFTDCLLQHQAACVLAVDVGYGQFDWRLRQNSRVKVLERTNIRRLQPPAGICAFDLAVADLSFTRTSSLLAHLQNFLTPDGQIIVLVKPQFELTEATAGGLDGKASGFDGVVRDAAQHILILENFMQAALACGLVPHGLMASPVKGPRGNSEFLFWASRSGSPVTIDIVGVVKSVH